MKKMIKFILPLFITSMMVYSCQGGCIFFDEYAATQNLNEGTDWTCAVGGNAPFGNNDFYFFPYIIQILEKKLKNLLSKT